MNNSSERPRSLYLRWRPAKFREVIGQEGVVRILRNSVKEGETSHAYLFAGPRGTGKTSVARILAKAINCEENQNGEPCNNCSSCRRIAKGTALDIVEIDGASNRRIGRIRELREEVNFAPAELKNKVYIIDEVHMLTNEAFNALLKTIEEPPANVTFIFATTEPEKVPATIVSRCQVFEFKEISRTEIQGRLRTVASSEGVEISDEALNLISSQARGSMRDGLVILEQIISSGSSDRFEKEDLFQLLGLVEGKITERYVDGLVDGRLENLLELLDDLTSRGKDLELFLDQVLENLRSRIKACDDPREMEKLIGLSRGILDTSDDLKRSSHKRIALEIGTLELVAEFGEDRKAIDSGTETGAEDREDTNREEETLQNEGRPEQGSENGSTDASGKQNGQIKNTEPWQEMITGIEEDKISIAAFLEEANPVLRNQDLYLEFSREFSFHKESLEEKKNFSYLKTVIEDYFDDVDELRIIYNEDLEKEEQKTGLLDEKAKLVRDKFGGNVVEEGRL
ncbi:DNA polymerase III subunit gamma/tau [Candidatus Bipolaricaulota bacterium]|nr:DNA polymerase III subunit gamma/tau [Candidatus Bipolaricaulota bacterium]